MSDGAIGFGFLLAMVAGWVVVAIIGGYVSATKHRPAAEGFVLSIILGPLGVLIAALLPTQEPPRKRWPDGHPMATRR